MWREVEFLSCSSDRQPEMHSSSSIFGPVVYCAVCTVLMASGASDVSNELCPNPNNSTDAAGMFKFICDLFILFLLTDFIITDQSNELVCCLMIVLVFFQLSREG